MLRLAVGHVQTGESRVENSIVRAGRYITQQSAGGNSRAGTSDSGRQVSRSRANLFSKVLIGFLDKQGFSEVNTRGKTPAI